MESGQCVTTFQGHTQSIWNVSWHHTSSFIATSSMDQTVKIWDLSRLVYKDSLICIKISLLISQLTANFDFLVIILTEMPKNLKF